MKMKQKNERSYIDYFHSYTALENTNKQKGQEIASFLLVDFSTVTYYNKYVKYKQGVF